MALKKWVEEQYPNWEKKKGAVIEGAVHEKRTNIGPNDSNLYVIDQGKGELVSIWGDTLMDAFFRNMTKGTVIKITYKGKTTSEKTGRSFHDYEFEYDEETRSQDPADLAEEIFNV